jgi:magnesium-transporting ATPase (P-type)
MKTRLISLLFLCWATWLVQFAFWRDWDNFPVWKPLAASATFAAHLFVLGTWTLAWLVFWKQFFGEHLRSIGFAICLSVAIISCLLPHFLQAHAPDWFSLSCGLTGVFLGACLYERFFGLHRAFAILEPSHEKRRAD